MKLKPLIPKNKKGNIYLIIFFFVMLFLILFLGFIMIVGSSIVNWVYDEAMPELTNIGTVENTNFTQYAEVTITPLNNIIQGLPWMMGVLYVLMLIGSFGIVFVINQSPTSRWLISIYFMFAILLIITAMFISNIYEEFYNGTDDLATRLKEHTLLSYMVLYSPAIFSIIIFISGIIIFSGIGEEYAY